MKFKRSYLVDELGLPYDAYLGCEIISRDIIDTSRWSIHYELIFKLKDKFYMTWYTEGATEQQDERPWECDNTVDCEEVEPVEVTVIKYVKKKGDENGS